MDDPLQLPPIPPQPRSKTFCEIFTADYGEVLHEQLDFLLDEHTRQLGTVTQMLHGPECQACRRMAEIRRLLLTPFQD